MASYLEIERADKVVTVRLNRPDKHNAFDEQLIAELTQAFRDLAPDRTARVIVLTANGPSFSAGADLGWMKRMSALSREENERDSLLLADLMAAIDGCPKPVLALVQGAAFGGGVGLVACCHLALRCRCDRAARLPALFPDGGAVRRRDRGAAGPRAAGGGAGGAGRSGR
jgi:methylglutaconyl-CoA hydratase